MTANYAANVNVLLLFSFFTFCSSTSSFMSDNDDDVSDRLSVEAHRHPCSSQHQTLCLLDGVDCDGVHISVAFPHHFVLFTLIFGSIHSRTVK